MENNWRLPFDIARKVLQLNFTKGKVKVNGESLPETLSCRPRPPRHLLLNLYSHDHEIPALTYSYYSKYTSNVPSEA